MAGVKVPKYADLPTKPGLDGKCSWGVFGEQDEMGCLNFLTPECVSAAAKLVKRGKVFRLDMPVGFGGEAPLFNRPQVQHRIAPVREGMIVFDDIIDAYDTQEGSQWDGFRHYGHPHGQLYNGVSPKDVKPGPQGRLGIQKWKSKLVGRGVLIDMLKWRAEQKRPVQATTTNEYFSVAEFEAALKAQKTKVQPGDFLLVRTGWMTQYKALPQEGKRSMGNLQIMKSCGVDPNVEMIGWLWDHHVAAIGCDNPMVEPYPPRADRGHLHPHALSYLGLPLGEQWDMDELAEDCARDGRYEFMFVSVPLHLVGGVASPPNAVAIK